MGESFYSSKGRTYFLMINFEKINLSFSFSGIYFFIGLVLLAAYAIYIYRYTLPPVSSTKKIILVLLRTLALILILFIIFEPVATLVKKIILQPVNLVFVDDSHSIEIEDGTQRSENVRRFIEGLNNNNLITGSELFTFGTYIKPFSYDSLSRLSFSEGSTDFSKIFSFVKNQTENIASITIISDGVITEGANPLFTAQKLNIPVFTIGLGDTVKRKDILIKNVLHNEFIYAKTPTTISATFINRGFGNSPAVISLYEDGKLLEQRTITLSADGTQNETFDYTPQKDGEKKLTLELNNHEGEFTFKNNRRVFYLNVLSNKVKILIVAGSPNPDLPFIKKSLEEDHNLSVKSLTQVAAGRLIEKDNPSVEIDSAQIIFLIGFPTKETNPDLLNKMRNAVTTKGKPFFLLLEGNTDFNRLKDIQPELPFIIRNTDNGVSEVQPVVQGSEIENPLLQNNAVNPTDAWNNLPPVFMTNSEISAKPESEVIVKAKMNNVILKNPLIITRRLGSERSIGVLASGIWRWKLQTATKQLNLFDSFIHNSVKWLRSYEEQKQVSVKSSKKLYALGEPVEFTAEVYDASYNPVTDAEVKIRIKHNDKTDETILNSIGSGLYEGIYRTTQTGDFTYSGTASRNNKQLGSDGGNFNIGEVDIEQLNPNMDYEFLSSLAENTGGKFFYYSDMKDLYPILKNIRQNTLKAKTEIIEIRLWSSEWFLLITIVLLGIEWFIRKQSGML
jgi:hypothetical protein